MAGLPADRGRPGLPGKAGCAGASAVGMADEQPHPPVPSAHLLQGRSVVQIEHNGALYQLRSTRLGKLILTK